MTPHEQETFLEPVEYDNLSTPIPFVSQEYFSAVARDVIHTYVSAHRITRKWSERKIRELVADIPDYHSLNAATRKEVVRSTIERFMAQKTILPFVSNLAERL